MDNTIWLGQKYMQTPTGGRKKLNKGWGQINKLHSSATKPISVLYVEDDKASQMLVKQAFGSHSSWQLQLASTLSEGLDLLQQKPDVILLDINLPDGRGYELLSHLKADTDLSHIPVIAVTSCAMRTQIEEGMSAGFFQYLVKPVDLNHLFHAIQSAVV